MPYTAEISRTNPSCFFFLVDQSASMIDPIGDARASKADVVADALNRLLTELAIRCAKEEGVRDYFYVSVLGYGSRSAQSAFRGELQGHDRSLSARLLIIRYASISASGRRQTARAA